MLVPVSSSCPISLMVRCQQFIHMEMSPSHCWRERKNPLIATYSDVREADFYMHTGKNTLCRWKNNKPTWNASFTDDDHLYSTATWPMVIAAAFFVPVILWNLGRTQHDTTPTSQRHSVTVKWVSKSIEIIDFISWEDRLACGRWWE